MTDRIAAEELIRAATGGSYPEDGGQLTFGVDAWRFVSPWAHEWPEVTAPATPQSNFGVWYVKDESGVSHPFFKADDGAEFDLTSAVASSVDHGSLAGLTPDDDHPQYLLLSAPIALGANWDVGAYTITGTQFISDIAIGTAPFVVTSTTLVTNLNSALLDSQTGSYYLDSDNLTGLDDIIGGSGIAVTDGSGTIVGGNATIDVGALTANHDWGAYQIRALQFYADGAADAGGVFFGDTTQIWQSAANILYTPDGFVAAGVLQTNTTLQIQSLLDALPSTDANLVRLFRTGSGGGAYPFTEAGHLVLQPRDAGEIRDVVILGGNPSIVRAVFYGDSGLSVGTNPVLFGTLGSETVGLEYISANHMGTQSGDSFVVRNRLGVGVNAPQGHVDLGSGIGSASQLMWQYSSANASSRSWGLQKDARSFGDFGIVTSDAQDYDLDTIRLLIYAAGSTSLGTNSLLFGTFGSEDLEIKRIAANIGGLVGDAWRVGAAGDYTEVEADGDVNFVGGGGLQFGEIDAQDNITETAIAGAGTPVQVTVFDTDDDSNGAVTPDHTNDHITVGVAGHFLVSVSATVNSVGGAGSRFEMTVKKNNGASQIIPHCDRNLTGGGGESGVISMSGFADLAAADTVEVWIENETNTQNYVVENISLSVMQVGGT